MTKDEKIKQIEAGKKFMWFRPEGMVMVDKKQALRLLEIHREKMQLTNTKGTLAIVLEKEAS